MFQIIKNKELYISDIIFESLKKYGAIKWHKNKNHSFYIKFKDVRLGSIRISNHRGREKYHYTYEIYKEDKDLERKIDETINGVISKSKKIEDFNPNKYIIFDTDNRCYREVKSLKEYKKCIFKN